MSATITESTSSAESSTTTATSDAGSQRLMSVDVLRGFDMFWIIGANSIVYALNQLQAAQAVPKSANPSFSLMEFLVKQFQHAYWEGFRFYDLIFPLFIFITGVSLVFSLSKTIERHGRAAAVKRIVQRSILLFLLGVIYNGGFSNGANTRLVGVLGRIALCYLFGGLIFAFFRPRAMVAICAGILIGYWAIMTFVPIHNISLEASNLKQLMKTSGISDVRALYDQTTTQVTGHYEKGLNVANHFDFLFLPGGKAYGDQFDPEGLLSTLPAIASCLLGVFSGLLLRSQRTPDKQKVLILVSVGIAALTVGWIWNLQFPVIKRIWTSSYVLVAGGYSAILLGLFYLVVDVWKRRSWCQPFLWLGMNSITIYMVCSIVDFRKLAERFVGGEIKVFFDNHLLKGTGDLVIVLFGLLLAFSLVRFLYRRNIFLRL